MSEDKGKIEESPKEPIAPQAKEPSAPEPSAPKAKEAAPEAPPASPQTPPKEAAGQATSPAPAKKEVVKKERPSKCANCGKSIKKKQYYYRNGKHYCTKRCWKSMLKKAEKTAEG